MDDEIVDRAASGRLPLLLIASLSGLVAALCGMAALATTGIAKSSWGFTFAAFVFLAPACAAAVAVVVVIGLPMHALIRSVGFTSRWMYVAGFLAITGACYFWLLGYRELDFAFLVPIAAIPGGLLFHHLAYRAGTSPSWSDRDWLIVGIWLCAWTFLAVSFVYSSQHPAPDPWHTREAVLHTGLFAGVAIVMLCGIAAGLARIWSVWLAMLIAGMGWAVPVVFTIAMFMTPLGPKQIRLSAGGRTFDIDWHTHPRREPSGFSFDTLGRGPFELIGRGQLNRRIYVYDATHSLAVGLDALGGDRARRPLGSELECESFERKPKTARRICTKSDDQGGIVTLIECEPGYCFHRFNSDGVGYALHYGPDHLDSWNEIQEHVVQLVSEFDKTLGSPDRRSGGPGR